MYVASFAAEQAVGAGTCRTALLIELAGRSERTAMLAGTKYVHQ